MKKNLFFLLFLIASCKNKPNQNQQIKGLSEYAVDVPGIQTFYDKKGVLADNGMVASAHPIASQVGVDILKAGGNAIDAAVATHFALAVVYPWAGNLGGGGFLVYRDKKGGTYTLDFREKAPMKAHRDMYLDESGSPIAGLSILGHLASGVPGSVDGMVTMHEKFGKLSWDKVVAPAIGLAQDGIKLTEREAVGLNRVKSDVVKVNAPDSPYYVRADKQEWKKGDTLVQRDLGRILGLIQTKKRAGFYEGECADLLVKEMERGKGIITHQDLRNYHSVWREAIVDQYKDFKIITMPPTSSGGVALMQLMKFVEPYPLKRWGWNSDSTVQVMIEAERRVYADRAKWLGDPDFVKVPVKELTSKTYLKQRMSDFSFEKATDSKAISGGVVPGYESDETTHYSVVDNEGNAVSITTTLNGGFGSKVVVQGGGFLMNNEMDDFSIKPGVPNMFGLIGNKANEIVPGKRMLSSMTPTIVEKDGKLLMVVGTPGGSTIITSVFQTILNVLEFGMTMQQSVNALKFHHQWLPDNTTYEKNAFSEATINNLKAKGYMLAPMSGSLGRMDCILLRPDGKLEGGSDPRGDNTSIGY
ncbi:gamma-glutamyltransferase [Emticicia sp. BO119]|uniref:gamma-glutamyltransferase n=1 Tax=Emticicia sp. BO119 TaxID=2757768 RepID=UPI0015F1033C|nr:gamma-glutamyltransferase [Emticicia sp. BO119]MBA4849429.1 gamma-glutamyltransferase [Emticicia sp. BO119]